MKQIRKSIFETNSSSSHSFTIAKKVRKIYDTLPVDENGTIEFTGGEFGWEWEKFNDALTKANYCAIAGMNDPDRRALFEQVIKDVTGAKNIVYKFELPDPANGRFNFDSYIDHQSLDTARELFEYSKLKNFIFSTESWLFGGNDNESPPPNYYITDPNKAKYCLTIEGITDIQLFYKKPSNQELKSAICNLMDKKLGYNSQYRFAWHDKVVRGTNKEKITIDSFGNLKNNEFYLYKMEYKYLKNGEYSHDELIDSKKYKFSIEGIKK